MGMAESGRLPSFGRLLDWYVGRSYCKPVTYDMQLSIVDQPLMYYRVRKQPAQLG